MDLLKKIELLMNAKSRSALPRRERTSILDKEEAQLLADIRKALGDVQAKEQELAQNIKVEQTRADDAAERGDFGEKQIHDRRVAEMEHYLRRESTMAINLEEKLAQLEEKLALAQEAVEKEAQNAARIDEEANKVLDQTDYSAQSIDPRTEEILNTPPEEAAPPPPKPVNLTERKSRLSD